MNKAQEERLLKLIEECSEVIHISCKILAYGYNEINIKEPSGPNNRIRLQNELRDLLYWLTMMSDELDIDLHDIHSRIGDKNESAMKYSQYQKNSEWKPNETNI